jgi:hypothetical protein
MQVGSGRQIVHKVCGSAFLFFVLLSPPGISSQQQQQPPTVPPPLNMPQRQDNGPDVPSDMQKNMEKKANEQRQADLKRDTDKLLKLSTELKEYVDKSNEHILSMDVIKKAEEIEKLAHSVKTKMRGEN